MNKHKIENMLTKKAIEELNQLGSTRYIRIRWIRAHAGTKGNETADNQAKYNANCRFPKEATPISYSKLNEIVQKLWSKRWTDSDNYRQTKIWLPVPNLAVSKQIVALPRKTLSTVVNLFTGHNWLNYHNVKIHQEGSPLCRLCQLHDETAIHVLAECKVLWQQRARHFVYPFISTTRPGWTLASITGFIEESSVQVFHL